MLAQVSMYDSVRCSLFKYNSAAGKLQALLLFWWTKEYVGSSSYPYIYDSARRSLFKYNSTVVKRFYSRNTLAQVPMTLLPFNETAAGGIITRSRG
jgi:hypothetical protein